MTITTKKPVKATAPSAVLILYPTDFRNHDMWMDICERLGVSADSDEIEIRAHLLKNS